MKPQQPCEQCNEPTDLSELVFSADGLRKICFDCEENESKPEKETPKEYLSPSEQRAIHLKDVRIERRR